MALRTVRVAELDPLMAVDLVDLGGRTGLLWRSPTWTVIGMGELVRIPVERPNGAAAAQSALAALGAPITGGRAEDNSGPVGPLALCAFPFDRMAGGELIVPEITIACHGHIRWLIAAAEVDSAVVLDRIAHLKTEESTARAVQKLSIESVRPAEAWRDEVVAVAIEELAARKMRKVVMARELLVRADTQFSVAGIVDNLAARFPAANLFAIDGFVGASPELLVARNGRAVRAQPLAGTAARGLDDSDDQRKIADLIESTKDQIEHRITIEWLLSELLGYCSYVDAEPEPAVVTMSNVHHLATLVEGVLSAPPASVLELVAAVHPTPAVGGDPQTAALRLINELEGMDRGNYAGPTGWVDAAGNGEFAVSVRTAHIAGDHARVWAGVGVVAESDPESELRETQAKFRAILGALLAG